MNTDRIEQLLSRYYDGLTTEDEERSLKRYFREAEVPVRWQQDKEFFAALEDEPEVPQGLEARLMRSIDEWEAQEKQTSRARQTNALRRLILWSGSVAAGLLILFSVHTNLDRPSTQKDTCATPEEAYAQTQYALTMLSTHLNKGMEGVRTAQLTVQKVEDQVNQQLNFTNYSQQ